MPLVAEVDSSTQSCKVVILHLETGTLVRHGRAPHPTSTEVHPELLATTPIAARVLDATAQLLGVEHGEFSRLALSVPAGSGGLVLLPYFEEASDLSQLQARGFVSGLAEANATPAHIARAAVEGILCSLAESLDALMLSGARPERLLLVGGAARSEAVRQIAPTVVGQPVVILSSEELGAYGAARQAA